MIQVRIERNAVILRLGGGQHGPAQLTIQVWVLTDKGGKNF